MSQDKLADQFTPLSPARILALDPDRASGPLMAALAARRIEAEPAATLDALREALPARPCQAVVLFPPAAAAAADLAATVACAAEEGCRGKRRFVAVVSGASEAPDGAPPVDLWLSKERMTEAVGPLEREVASARLAEAVEEIERLRAAILYARETAHDIAQPLTTILARAQLLAMSAKPEEKHHKGATIIAEEADRMATIAERFYRLKEMVLPPK